MPDNKYLPFFKISNLIKKYKWWMIFSSLFIVHIFLRFYQLETRFPFGTDQVRMAWVMKGMIVDHIFPLVGPPNKLGSGIYVGPLYYYLISIFYYFTNLDPIAGAIFAGVTSIFSFLTLFYITRKLFSFGVALLAIFINTISFSGIQFDRVQWEMNFIPPVGLIAFYTLYKIINGQEKYAFLLSIALGIAFNIHITIASFLSLIILCVSPFFPKTKKMASYLFVSFLIFLSFLFPFFIKSLQTQNVFFGNIFNYLKTNFSGIHLTRILQLKNDAFIQFESFFTFSYLRILSLLLLPIFIVTYYRNSSAKKKILTCCLVGLFFIVPWLVMSIYKGEITDYYFSTNRFLALFIISYLLVKLLSFRKLLVTTLTVVFLFYYTYINLNNFFSFKPSSLQSSKIAVEGVIRKGKTINFESEKPQSYLYYIYTRKK